MLQLPEEPTLRWRPGQYDLDDAYTREDLTAWPDQAPRYRDQPAPGERTLIPTRWDPYPVFDPAEERATQRRQNRRDRRRGPTTTTTARRTTNVATRLAHRRRAQQFIGLIPLPPSFHEFDRLSGQQRIQVALLFSIKEELTPSGQGHPTILPWRRTVIQEYEDELAIEWATECIECGLPRGPWCF